MNSPNPQPVPTQNDLNKELRNALKAGDYALAETALKNGADVNHRIEEEQQYGYGSTVTVNLLHTAVEEADYTKTKWLLNHGADTNIMLESKTPLLRAVDKAVYNGQNPDQVDKKREGYRITRLLLEHGADPNGPPQMPGNYNYPPQYALHKAAAAGNEPLAHLLIRYGADVNLRSRDGSSPIWSAASNNRQRLSCILINAGADPTGHYNNRAQHGRMGYNGTYKTALHHLHYNHSIDSEAYAEKVALVKTLLDAGADITAKDSEGKTPLQFMRAVTNGNGAGLAEVYKKYEQYPVFDQEKIGQLRRRHLFSVDVNGNTLLDSPSTWKHFDEIAQHLQSIGEPLRIEDLQAQNNEGKTWLERGIECFALKSIVNHLAPASQPNSVSALFGVKPRKGEATLQNTAPGLRAVASRMQMDVLFSPEVWNGRTKDEARAVYNALPVEIQEDVNNFQQILIKLPDRRPVPGRKGYGRYEVGGDFGLG